VAWYLTAPLAPESGTGDAVAVDVTGGEFLTQVPGQAKLTLEPRGKTATELAAQVNAAIGKLRGKRRGLEAGATVEGERVVVAVRGRAVHSSLADQGQNALWDLAAVTSRLRLVQNGISAMLSVLATRSDQDHWGKQLGVAYQDGLMGRLLVAPTVLRVEDGTVKLSVNMRRPRGKDKATFEASLQQAAQRVSRETGGRVTALEKSQIGEPHVVDLKGRLGSTLLDIYRRHTRQPKAKPISIRGGTFARLFPGAVDFGPNLPGLPYRGHAPDEYIELATLDSLAVMLAEALYRLR
jgi:acetylornithine deacetylase/succinyl-diaminopimelate desuccinylase-like protein